MSKTSILNTSEQKKEENKIKQERKRKNPNPQRLEWVDGHRTEIGELKNYIEIDEEILKQIIEKLKEQKLSLGDKFNQFKNKKPSIKEKIMKTMKNSQKNTFSNLNSNNYFTNLIDDKNEGVNSNINLKSNFNRAPNEDQQSTSSQSSKLNIKRHCAKKSAKCTDSNSNLRETISLIENDNIQIFKNKIDSGNFNTIKEEEYKFLNEENLKNYELPLNDSQNIDHELADNISDCFLCNWKFPHYISEDEKNAHINFCVEGKGQEHRENYMKSLNLINSQEKSRDNSMIIDEENLNMSSHNSNLSINQQRKDVCPICKKVLGMKLDKNIQKHIFDCTRAQEAMIDNGARKRKYVVPK